MTNSICRLSACGGGASGQAPKNRGSLGRHISRSGLNIEEYSERL